ncbi:MAG: NAD(+)--dinitrogen-reductase ADP-D-ribosyltransferase [Pseudomonadota bacterium]
MFRLAVNRGSNDVEQLMQPEQSDNDKPMLLLNNLNTFSASIERAYEFGVQGYCMEVPLSKIFFYADLLPLYLKTENEYLVLGGVYECERVM